MPGRVLELADALVEHLRTGVYTEPPTSVERVNVFALERAKIAPTDRRVIVQPGSEEWTRPDRGRWSQLVTIDVGLLYALDAARSQFDAAVELRDELGARLRDHRPLAGGVADSLALQLPWDQQAAAHQGLFFSVFRVAYRFSVSA